MAHLRTAQDVIRKLGGFPAVCELTRAEPKAAWNWARVGMFPADTYVVMQRALKRRGASAPAWLWKQRGIEKRAA